LEEEPEPLKLDQDEVVVRLRPFEIKTLRVTPMR
jgi:hypothetical protein